MLREFRASLVAVTTAAYTIEAVYGDIKYLINQQRRRASRQLALWHSFHEAFGIPASEASGLQAEMGWLFGLRAEVVHAYTELEVPETHPAGINTGAEMSRFNAVTSMQAVDLAMRILQFAGAPPKPASRWIERWAEERRPYHETVVAPLREARRLDPPVKPTEPVTP